VKVPFMPGRMDASQEQTDVESFAARADRRRLPQLRRQRSSPPPEERCWIDKAQLLTLTAPEMTVLVGGLRVLGANVGQSQARRLHRRRGHADQRLLRQPARHGTEWKAGRRRGHLRRTRPQDRRREVDRHRVDLSSARTRSSARSPRSTAAPTRKEKFVNDFVAAWTKVMNADRFDLYAPATRAARAPSVA
jgi:catalase-peroxidase